MQYIQQLDSRGFERGLYKDRVHDVAGVVIHTTGSGPWRRWSAGDRFATPFDAAKFVYTEISDYCGHYLICGETGRTAQMCLESVAAWHVGGRGGYKYRWKNWQRLDPNTRWWSRRWPHLRSPRDLMGGKAWAPRPNQTTIGIEVSPPFKGPREPWKLECWKSITLLCTLLSTRYNIPFEPEYFVSHSDIHPLTRSSAKGPWDPGRRQFDPLRSFDRLIFPEKEIV